MTIDLEKLAAPIAPAAPCGVDLAYDPEFVEVERLAQGVPERQIGSTILPAEEPKWPELRASCLKLLGRSRDLRLQMVLLMCLLREQGLAGLRDGLKLLKATMEQHWDTVYPQLSPEDQLDPTERMNTIASLASDAPQGTMSFVWRLREVPLSNSRAGKFSLRDILIGDGQWPAAPDSKPPDKALIEAAFRDTPVDQIQASAGAVEECLESIQGMETVLSAKVTAQRVPDFAPILQVLKQIRKVFREQLKRHGVAVAQAGDEAAGPQGTPPGEASSGGDIRSPQDVVQTLEKICQYYQRHEPSSPVPLLLRRAQRLVSRSFLEIMRDLTPDAMTQIQIIGGITSTALDSGPPAGG